jgi:hypothetical protein
MSANQQGELLMKPELSHIVMHVSLEGRAWGGFPASEDSSIIYGRGKWPGLKKALASLARSWGDCEQASIKPYYAQIHYCLKSGEWTRWIVKELDETDFARLGLAE